LLGDRGEKSRGDSEIEKFIAECLALFFYFRNLLLQVFVSIRILEIAFYIVYALREPVPQF
jgi:hypothetical protein